MLSHVKEQRINMTKKRYMTPCGGIHYRAGEIRSDRKSLAFLPGLTADHRLFDKQIAYFAPRCNVFVWDAPGHAASRPFSFDFDLMDKARWLHEILTAEGMGSPILVGQSMGGYVAQAYCEMFPEEISGFVAIDSAPLQRKFTSAIEIWLLKHMEPVYRYWPWKSLLKLGSKGVSVTDYGQKLMHDIMMVYDGDHKHYAKLSGHGMRMLAKAMEADLPYKIPCPAILICGEKDRAGSCIRYNKVLHKDTSIRLEWIKNAGHNANTDQPEIVNGLIEELVQECECNTHQFFQEEQYGMCEK